jgi:flagellar basal-body rod modification protein FlgD
MNPVDPINGFAAFGAPGTTPSKKSQLDTETFLRLLTVQLANQNPLEPMSDSDFFAQVAQLGQVDSLGRVEQSLAMSQASSMIGKDIVAFRPMTQSASAQNELVRGRVESLSVQNGETILNVRESNGGIAQVKMDQIQEVSQATS